MNADQIGIDLLAMLQLDAIANCICWVHARGASIPLLAVAVAGSPHIRIYDGRGENQQPLQTLNSLHRFPVSVMVFNNEYDCVVSGDENGMLEYWTPTSNYEKPENVWKMKSLTNLFEFKKSKSVPVSITMSPT